jgi:glycosyltransferase involved in cell wall biosynthesis
LAYGMFGSEVIGQTLGREVEWLPHGFDSEIFKPSDPTEVWKLLKIERGVPLVGCVMSNQQRKDWGIVFGVAAWLKKELGRVKVWCKVDTIQRHWDLAALVADFHLEDTVVVDEEDIADDELAKFYSACDLTILPSLGEGFGLPLVESLACGTPCIHGNYAGGAELVPKKEWLVEPKMFRLDTPYNHLRPVFDPKDWVECVKRVLEEGKDKEFCQQSVEHLAWKNLKGPWTKWIEAGL